ncbi:MAG: hypothetical protein ACXW3X_06865 [Rhodoplanes sp.]
MLDLLTVVLMLLAGLLHASWHSLVKYGSDQVLVLTGMGLVAAMVAGCALPFLPVPSFAAWAVIVGSVFLHVGYKLALAAPTFWAISDKPTRSRGALSPCFLPSSRSPCSASRRPQVKYSGSSSSRWG